MQYRNLGRSGLKVSEISLGSWISFNNDDDIRGPERIIDKAYELGINFYDTANGYHKGASETILGKVLSKYPRESYCIATKVYWPVSDNPNDCGLSRKHIMAQIESSMKRLNVDYIDLYYCHWYDSFTPVEETLRTMDDLIKKGMIRYYGVSNWTAAQIAYGLREVERYSLNRISANQPSYSILDRYIENETIPLSEREGIGQVVYSPLAQGVLSGKYGNGSSYPAGSRALNPLAKGEVSIRDFLTDSSLSCVQKLNALAKENSMSLSEMSLAFVLRKPIVSSALTGASSPEQIETNVKASGIKLSDDILKEIDEILKSHPFHVKHNIVPW